MSTPFTPSVSNSLDLCQCSDHSLSSPIFGQVNKSKYGKSCPKIINGLYKVRKEVISGLRGCKDPGSCLMLLHFYYRSFVSVNKRWVKMKRVEKDRE